jgi:hypothetical protein
MKTHLPLVLTVLLVLSGCPDNKVPKAPPKVPEPKADTAAARAPGVAANTARQPGHFA